MNAKCGHEIPITEIGHLLGRGAARQRRLAVIAGRDCPVCRRASALSAIDRLTSPDGSKREPEYYATKRAAIEVRTYYWI